MIKLISTVFLILIILGCFYIYPQYNIYSSRLDSEALLAHAKSSKEVAVAEAKAKMESSELLAEAEIIRAKGVAQANKIIGDSLKENEAYLRYLWIQNIEQSKGQIIYVPTEANLPILEANRNKK